MKNVKVFIATNETLALQQLLLICKREAASCRLPFYSTLPKLMGVTHAAVSLWMGAKRNVNNSKFDHYYEVARTYLHVISKLKGKKLLPVTGLGHVKNRRQSQALLMSEFKRSFK